MNEKMTNREISEAIMFGEPSVEAVRNAITRALDDAEARVEAKYAGLVERKAELHRRLSAVMPLFEEARDALCAISEVSAKLHGVRLDLADRMDTVGVNERWLEVDRQALARAEGGGGE